MNKSIITLILVLSFSLNIYSSFGRQQAGDNKKKAVLDTNKPKLVKSIRPWTDERMKLIEKESPDALIITAMALSPNGKFLAWGDQQNNVFLWFSQEDKLVVIKDTTVTKQVPYDPFFDFPIESIRFITNDVLSWLDMERNRWWADIKKPKSSIKTSPSMLFQKTAMRGIITPDSFILCIERESGFLASLFKPTQYELRNYSLENGKEQATCRLYPKVRGYYHFVEAMALSEDDSLLAISSQCNSGLVRLKDFKLIQTFNTIGGNVLAISPNNSLVAVEEGEKGGFKVCDTKTGKPVRTITEISDHSHWPSSFAFENNDTLWFPAGWEMYRFNIKSGKMKLVWKRGPVVMTMLLDRDIRCLYLGGRADGTVYIYELP